MPKLRSSQVKRRNIALKERFLLELSRERGKRLTFDDTVSALLDECENRSKKVKEGA